MFEKHLPEIRRLLGDRLHKIYFTKSAGGGERKARLAVQEGADLVVSCGGDGTLHEVLNGVMDAETRKAQCAIALFPIGTGNDFAKVRNLVSLFLVYMCRLSHELIRTTISIPHDRNHSQ